MTSQTPNTFGDRQSSSRSAAINAYGSGGTSSSMTTSGAPVFQGSPSTPSNTAVSTSFTSGNLSRISSATVENPSPTSDSVPEYDQFGHGHYFTKKTFHKPTYCHHCTDMLWGLIGQGFICEGMSPAELYFTRLLFDPLDPMPYLAILSSH